MNKKFFSFVWRHSKRDQIFILFLTVISFPLVYLSLEIPKIIINQAIQGEQFPVDVLGFQIPQIPYLLLLCLLFLLMVVIINGIKYVMNIAIGMCGERMLRRLRFILFEQVMRFKMSRFRTTKPGEVIQAMLGEIEPLGGFIGEVISTPAFQGGLLVVYSAFIFVQDPWLGLAAVSLYPLQAILIPLMQAKVVKLNKQRATNTRALADAISESVGNIVDIQTNDTARWHMAQITSRLHRNTLIRIELYDRKFMIKFVNNFLNQLTPFFFYLIGGYLVIDGDLNFGALVAVLAAYKDLAGPWKEVLNYIQRWNDFNSRYVFVVENFMGDDVYGPERIFPGPDSAPLAGDLNLSDVEGGPGTGGLSVPRMTLRPGQTLAVLGGGNGAREALMRLIVGLAEPAQGRVAIGGAALADATLPQIGATLAYVGSDPGLANRSMRDNLVYGLLRNAPDLAQSGGAESLVLLREARRTGNLTADPEGDWVDYAAAGVADAAALEQRLFHLIDLVGLGDDVFATALNARLSADQAAAWTQPVLAVRAELLASVGAEGLSDLVEPWVPGQFNTNGTLLENALFALPAVNAADMAAFARLPIVAKILADSGAAAELGAIGWEIAREFHDLVGAVDAQSPVLDSFAAYPKPVILAAADLVAESGVTGFGTAQADQRQTLIGLGAVFVPVRDRLDVLGGERIPLLMAAQARARALIGSRSDFVAFDQDEFSPAQTVAENILNAKRRFDRRTGWRGLDERIEAAIARAGLRAPLIRLGLQASVGSNGANLSAVARRRVALIRALVKRPRLLVLDGVIGSASPADAALRAAIRDDLFETMIVYAASAEDACDGADLIARIGDDGALAVSPTAPTALAAEDRR